jgi:dihydroneopterin aldolase / 2-amino-4-hydroxy-6-hydroxymethyldihydropteridine diphosphokinase
VIHKVYLGLGSNLGDKEDMLNRAIHLLDSNRYIDVKKTSVFITSKAKGTGPQPDYLNGACVIETILTPEELLHETKMIEQLLGRTTKSDYAPRLIDIDILVFDDLVYSTDDLIIPHPLMHERDFVLKPLSDLEPNLLHPILNESILSLYSDVC